MERTFETYKPSEIPIIVETSQLVLSGKKTIRLKVKI